MGARRLLLLGLSAAAAAAAFAPDRPHLEGIFLSLYHADTGYNSTQWDQEMKAMADVGIKFVAVRAALAGSSNSTAGGCVLGTYRSYYPSTMEPRACFLPAVDGRGAQTLGLLLDAAAKHGVEVHITPAMPHTPFAWPPSQRTQPNKTVSDYFKQLTSLQADAFADIWAAFPQHHSTIRGVYTALEQWNGPSWMNGKVAGPMATEYFEPLATLVRKEVAAGEKEEKKEEEGHPLPALPLVVQSPFKVWGACGRGCEEVLWQHTSLTSLK